MEQVVFEGVEVDRCTGCGGIWFDFQEQQQLKAVKGASAIDTGDKAIGQQMNEVSSIGCPKCGTLMTHLADVEQTHIAYEACPHDYGVFFDAGEFADYSRKTLVESLRRLF
jgi:Zn-finger nucleic acid-binding protein